MLSVVSWSRLALPQPRPVIDLQWDSPSECPNADAVQKRIRDITGDVVVASDRLRAEGKITPDRERYRLVLVITSGSASGTRLLESESCDHLTGAAAVALGILVRVASNAETALTPDVLGEPDADATNHPAQGSNTAPPIAASAAPPAQAADLTPAQRNMRSQSAVNLDVRLPLMRVAVGMAPGVTLGYGVAVGTEYSGWQASLTGSYWMTRDIQSDWPGYGANLKQYSVDLDLCKTWKLDALEGGPCVRGGLTRVSATGTGSGMALRTASMAAFSAGPVLTARYRLGAYVALHIDGGPEVFASRPRLVNPAFGQIYEYPLFAVKFGLGAEWIF